MVRLRHLLDTAVSLIDDANAQSRARATAIERAYFRKVWTLSNGFLQILHDPEIMALVESRLGSPTTVVSHADYFLDTGRSPEVLPENSPEPCPAIIAGS